MKIVNMKKFKINVTKGVTKQYIGFAIMNDEGNFLSVDGNEIFIPCGGRSALKSLLPIADTFKFVALH